MVTSTLSKENKVLLINFLIIFFYVAKPDEKKVDTVDSIEDVTMEELDTIQKKELEFWITFWNTFWNDIFKHQNGMVKNKVPK